MWITEFFQSNAQYIHRDGPLVLATDTLNGILFTGLDIEAIVPNNSTYQILHDNVRMFLHGLNARSVVTVNAM